MAQYIPLLEFYGGGLPLVSTMYASSECYFGINLRPLDPPEDVAYTLLPNMCYYEFIKVEKDGEEAREDGKVVDLVDVEAGGYYELLVTTFTGEPPPCTIFFFSIRPLAISGFLPEFLHATKTLRSHL